MEGALSATSVASSLLASFAPSCCVSGLVASAVESFAVEDEDSRRLSKERDERDRERSVCEGGRGVISVVASSNVSC